MAPIKDEAIVLRRLEYSETSQVLVFFAREHGRQRLIAKGIKRGTKKKAAVGIDLLERGDIMFLPCQRKAHGLGTLTEWRQNDAYLGLREDLRRIYAGQYAAEITAAMTEDGDPHPALFDALTAVLDALRHTVTPKLLLIDYQQALLRDTGLWPDLTRCVICNRQAPEQRAGYFSAHQGGLVCRRCLPRVAENRLVLAAVLTALRENHYPDQTVSETFDLLDYTISQTIGRPTTMSKFITE
ncbi:MAG: DNA repair protein RecO [Phycisphaerales bacterium]|nr:DNA repair protein RecO [Phycisphaerales bacterium]